MAQSIFSVAKSIANTPKQLKQRKFMFCVYVISTVMKIEKQQSFLAIL